MTEALPTPQRVSLRGFADYLANQQTTILEQWLLAVHRDTQIQSADRLPNRQLLDHLPALLRELSEFLRVRDADILTGTARRDAATHGELRWQDGYRIDEVLRELEAVRHLVVTSVFRYRELHPDFKGLIEVSAHALIHQFFGEITVTSARQFMNEQQAAERRSFDELVSSRQELGRTTVRLERALKERHVASSVVARELRSLTHRVPNTQPATGAVGALHSFVEQLAEYAELSGGSIQAQCSQFDPRTVFSELIAAYKDRIGTRGLRLLTDCVTAPPAVLGDRDQVLRITSLLLEDALQHTQQGQITLSFTFSEAPCWKITISDTRQRSEPATLDVSNGGLGLAIVGELIALLDGSMATETQAGVGVRVEVSLPRS